MSRRGGRFGFAGRFTKTDAAPVRPGIDEGAQSSLSEAVDQTLHEMEVHPADQVGELLGQAIKWTVCQAPSTSARGS